MTRPPATRVKLAAIGAGWGAAPHFNSLRDLTDHCELVCLHVRHPDRLDPAIRPQGVPVTGCLRDLLENPHIQGVLVLTPPDTHLALVQQLAAAGKHILLEKPLDVDLSRARQLVDVCEQHGVMLSVMLQHRMRAGWTALRELLHTGELGQLTSASADVRWWRPQSYYDEPGRGTFARDGGGVLMTQAIHTLDLLLCLTALPERVLGVTRTSPVHRMEAEDLAAALLLYADGAVATLHATTAATPGYPERIELNATLGSATLVAGALQVNFADGRTFTRDDNPSSNDARSCDHAPHRTVLLDFIHAIQQGRAPLITGRSALAAHQVIDAITRSAQSGTFVRLDG